jgi:N-acetylneuraminic acid mutarotase
VEETRLPEGLNAPAAVAIGSRIYLIGGFSGVSNLPTEKVRVYDTRTKQWSEAAPLPAPRGGHAAVAHEGRIHVFGGGNSAVVFEDAIWTVGGSPAAGRATRRRGATSSSGSRARRNRTITPLRTATADPDRRAARS